MSFSIQCPECDERLTVPDQLAGKKVRCKKCGAAFRATAPDEDDEPRKRRQDEDGEPRARRRRDEDDEDVEDRPRRKAGGKKGRSKAGAKKGKKPITVGYIVGLIVAFIFFAGAVGFLGWRAGLFGGREEKKEEVVETGGGEPKFVAADARIGEMRKETVGPDGERATVSQRVKLSMDMPPMGDGVSEAVLSYEMLVGAELPRAYRLVVLDGDRMHTLDVDPSRDGMDPRRGTFTVPLSAEERRKFKKFWIALISGDEKDVKKNGLRVSNVVAMP